jgi:signal transduction histidine kinase
VLASNVLHEFLRANREKIIALAREKAALRRAPQATELELSEAVPMFVDQLADVLRHSQKSSRAIAESAGAHGASLLRSGFTCAQVVHDYGNVCQAITELAGDLNAPISTEEFQTLNHCLDDAIAGAVTEYTRLRELSIGREETERLGALAHELRNPLGAAMLAYQILRMGSVGIAGSTGTELGRCLKRVSSLIDRTMAQVRLDAGIRSPERVSVFELVEELEVSAAMDASSRNLALSVAAVERGIDVYVDRALLVAAVGNLLQNAFKFTRPDSCVSLNTSATADRVQIEVADQCGGLPAGKAEDLFRAFRQKGTNRSGLGLGLSISRKSVEAVGGTINVRDLPGTGCVFTIDLPRQPGP